MGMNDDETAVRATLDRVYAAWAANDTDTFVGPYAHDATATLPGVQLPDRAAIRGSMAAAFAGPLKGTRATHDVRRVRFVAADVAVVTSEGAVVPSGREVADDTTRSLDTFVLARHDGKWLVEAFHTCPAAQ
jgi:uncharacterized protein (TIGR02246 family)